MSFITQSGIYSTEKFQQILITQGLVGYTLVTRKKVLFRLFVAESDINFVDPLVVRVTYDFGLFSTKKIFLFSKDSFFIETTAPNGPSIGIILDGRIFPSSFLTYKIEFFGFFYYSHFPNIIFQFTTPKLKFLPSGNLRILVKTVESITRTAPWGNKIQSNIFWLLDLGESMARLGAMLPVSDGVTLGDTNPSPTGLAYLVGEKIDAWPVTCPNGDPPSIPDQHFPNFPVCNRDDMNKFILEEAKTWNSNGIRIDNTVTFRHRDVMKPPEPPYQPLIGEIPGGNGEYDQPAATRLATVVGGNWTIYSLSLETTAPIMAQEVAHNYGVVSKDSPYFDGGGHSNKLILEDPYAFDFVRLRPYSCAPTGYFGHYLGDVMSLAWHQGRDSTLFSAYDWEHLRKRLVQLAGMAFENVDEADTEKVQKKVIDHLQIAFKDLQQIKVEDPESVLSPKSGFEWHWTHQGFQLLRKDELKRNSYGLTSNIEEIFFTLKKLDIQEVYVPIEGKPLTIAINPERSNLMQCGLGEFTSFQSKSSL